MLWILGGGGTFIVAFITFWMTLSSRISDAQNDGKSAKAEAASANSLAAAAIAKSEFLRDALNNHRVETAGKTAALETKTESTAQSLAQLETRLIGSLEEVRKSVDHLSDTIIKTLGEIVGRQQK